MGLLRWRMALPDECHSSTAAAHLPKIQVLTERTGAVFIHHDSGIDDRSELLDACVVRADPGFFPIECVSHNAVAVIKRTSKPYVALRSSGLSSFPAALQALPLQRHAPVVSEQNAEIAPVA